MESEDHAAPRAGDDSARAAIAAGRPVVVFAALAEELAPIGDLPAAGPDQERQGLRILTRRVGPTPVLAAVGGVGKARAARAASLLLEAAQGAGALLVVGVAGGLRASLGPGTLVHCTRAIQSDLAVREGREVGAHPELLAAWRAVAPGEAGWFVTADRPVLSPWRRLRLARAFAGPCVADMETAAAAAVSELAGVPWAALRAVSDRAGLLGGAEFRKNFPVQAGRAAASVPALLESIHEEEGLS